MRKIVRLTGLAAVLCFSFFSSAAVLTVPDSNGPAGSVVQVPVNVDDASGIAGFQFTMVYDPEVLKADQAAAGALTPGWLIMTNDLGNGTCEVIGLDMTLQGLAGGSGALVRVNFAVIGNPGQTSDISLADALFVDKDNNVIETSAVPGTFTVDPAGVITVSGQISYAGGHAGELPKKVHIGLFSGPDFSGVPVYSKEITSYASSPAAYDVPQVAPGTYYAAAYLDLEGDGQRQPATDPMGAYGGDTPSAFTVADSAVSNIDITLADPLPPPANRTVSIPDNLTVVRGQQAQVPVRVDSAARVRAFRFFLALDNDVFEETVVVQKGSDLGATWAVAGTRFPDGVRIMGMGIEDIAVSETAVLANVILQIKSDVPPGIYPIPFADAAEPETTYLKDESDDLIDADYVDGLIIVSSLAKGDVNGDLSVGVSDAIAALKVAAGLPPGVDIHPEADVNNDEAIGVAEAIFALKVAAGIEPDPYGAE